MAKKKTKLVKKPKALQLPHGLNLKQKEFSELYVSPDRELFGNGVQCYIEVYSPDTTKKGWYQMAKASASRLLTNVNLCKYINELLDNAGFNDENVDKQHLFLINQHADLKTKMGAIKEYNALKKRTSEPKGDLIPQSVTLNQFNIGSEMTEEFSKKFGDFLKDKTRAK